MRRSSFINRTTNPTAAGAAAAAGVVSGGWVGSTSAVSCNCRHWTTGRIMICTTTLLLITACAVESFMKNTANYGRPSPMIGGVASSQTTTKPAPSSLLLLFMAGKNSPPAPESAELKSLLQSTDYNSDVVVQAYRKGRGLSSSSPPPPPPPSSSSAIKYEDLESTKTVNVPPPSVTDTTTTTTLDGLVGTTTTEDGRTGTNNLIPTDISNSISKSVDSMNEFLKNTQDGIQLEQQQRAAAVMTDAAANKVVKESAAVTTNSFATQQPKVPTLAEYFSKSLMAPSKSSGGGGGGGTSSPSSSLSDIKLPDISSMKLPDGKIPDLRMATPGGNSGGLGDIGAYSPPPGKALPLGDFLKATASGVVPVDPTTAITPQSVVQNAQVKFSIMITNFFNLIGREPPSGLTDPNKLYDFSVFSLSDIVDSIREVQTNLPEGAPWIGVAVGTAMVVLGAAKGEDTKTTAASEAGIKKASAALGGLTSELVSVGVVFSIVVGVVVVVFPLRRW
jgi:hypothetical protein